MTAKSTSLITVSVALAVALTLGGEAQAQTTAVCTSTPTSGQRIECSEDSTSTTDIRLSVEGVDIVNTALGDDGIQITHDGNADIDIDLIPDSDMKPGSISTGGESGTHGLWINHTGNGRIDIESVENDITTTQGIGVWVEHKDENSVPGIPTGDITLNFSGSDIQAAGDVSAHGIRVVQNAHGVLDFDFHGGSIETTGDTDESSMGVFLSHGATGLLDVDIQDSTITTSMGTGNNGLYATHQESNSNGDIKVRVRNSHIKSLSTALDATYSETYANGIYARNNGPGDVEIDLQGGSVETKGVYSYGVYGVLFKADHGGEVSIQTDGNHAITTSGVGGHGIVALNFGTMDTSTISVDVGGSVTTTGAGSQGVRVGTVSSGAPGPRCPHRR